MSRLCPVFVLFSFRKECSGDCVYDYYEYDTNYGECRHPDFDIEHPDHCPGYYSKEDAKADAKLRYAEKG